MLGQIVAPQIEAGHLQEPLLGHQGGQIWWRLCLALHHSCGGGCIGVRGTAHHRGTVADSEHGWAQIHRGQYVG